FFFQAEDGIRDFHVTGVQTCALPICARSDSRIPIGTVVCSAIRLVVRVPVLSRHSTSTLLSDSTALICCTSAPFCAIRSAPSARSEERRVGKGWIWSGAPDRCRKRKV